MVSPAVLRCAEGITHDFLIGGKQVYRDCRSIISNWRLDFVC